MHSSMRQDIRLRTYTYTRNSGFLAIGNGLVETEVLSDELVELELELLFVVVVVVVVVAVVVAVLLLPVTPYSQRTTKSY